MGGEIITERPFETMIVMSIIMGFSIYLSFPIILKKNVRRETLISFVSIAVGILLFLIADIFSDVSSFIYASGSYIANPLLSLLFVISSGGFFALLYILENSKRNNAQIDNFGPSRIAFIVSLGMGLQNLTEGLVFGSAYVQGITNLFIVVLIGFILQNFTEGFPIISSFIGGNMPKNSTLSLFYFIGGFPTVVGSMIGYYYSSLILNIIFDGFAIGAIIYVTVPMMRTIFKLTEKSVIQSLPYLGIILGFLIGFAVNAI